MKNLTIKRAALMYIILFISVLSYAQNNDFIRRYGAKLVVGQNNEEIILRGMGLSDLPDEETYQDIANLDMNVIRIMLDYYSFYDPGSPLTYKSKVWEWINEHIKLANKYNMYLILQMGSIEGAQFVPVIDYPYDYSIWSDKQKQNNFKNLWKEIAERYKNENIIAGYSLFLEPVCSESVDQWKKLANETILEIRSVDKNHLILVERIYGENKLRREIANFEISTDRAFFLVNDDNVAYEFYFFERDSYTHQFAPWRPEPSLRKSLKYPDDDMIILYQDDTGYKTAFTFNKDYIKFYIRKQIEFGKKHNVPMFLWGFGTAKMTFNNNRGGAVWITDVTEVLNNNSIHWTYWQYENTYFGISDIEEAKDILKKAAKK